MSIGFELDLDSRAGAGREENADVGMITEEGMYRGVARECCPCGICYKESQAE